ncbi:MAG TPA: YigZ family protein [bacterium]|nr:YigZ family protein [bacterium]
MEDSFLTIATAAGPFEIKEKGSRFLSFVTPVVSEGEALSFVSALRKRYHDATHVCWAYRLGDGEERASRYSDDGEPSGSAGLPLYQELARRELFNVACAVVRYFGGVKLGTGGLCRAYGAAARLALDETPPRTETVTVTVAVTAPFDLLGAVLHVVKKYPGASVSAPAYREEGVVVEARIPRSKAGAFKAELVERSGGRVTSA